MGSSRGDVNVQLFHLFFPLKEKPENIKASIRDGVYYFLISSAFWLAGGTRISQQVSGAHEGGIFSLCVLKDGTMVSGGGKDRKVVLWDHSYKKKAEMEVRAPKGDESIKDAVTE